MKSFQLRLAILAAVVAIAVVFFMSASSPSAVLSTLSTTTGVPSILSSVDDKSVHFAPPRLTNAAPAARSVGTVISARERFHPRRNYTFSLTRPTTSPAAVASQERLWREVHHFFDSSASSSSSSSNDKSSRIRSLGSSSSSAPMCTEPKTGFPLFSVKYKMRATLCWTEDAVIIDGDLAACVGMVRISPSSTFISSASSSHGNSSSSSSSSNNEKNNYCDDADRTIKISSLRRWASLLRHAVGPLDLRLILAGPEFIQGDVLFNRERCENNLHFMVLSPGSYALNVKVMHDDYHGVDETHHRTRHTVGKHVFDVGLPSLQCKIRAPHVAGNGESSVLSTPSSSSSSLSSLSPAQSYRSLQRWIQRPLGLPPFNGRHLRGSTLQLVQLAATAHLGVDPRAVPPFGLWKLAAKSNTDFALSPWLRRSDTERFLSARQSGGVVPADDKGNNSAGDVLWKTRFAFPIERWMNVSALLAASSCRATTSIVVLGDSQARSILYSLKNYIETALNNETTLGAVAATDANESYALRDAAGKKIKRAQHSLLNGRFDLSYVWDSSLLILAKRHQRLLGSSSAAARQAFFTVEEQAERAIEIEDLKQSRYENPRKDPGAEAAQPKLLLDAADVVVAGYGIHAASWAQWTFATFNRRSKRIAATLCRLAAGEESEGNATDASTNSSSSGRRKSKTVIWVGAPAFPKAKLVAYFRATNMRLAIFNSIALRHFEEQCALLHVRLSFDGDVADARAPPPHRTVLHMIDFFALSSPVLKHSKDGAHYDGSVVISSLAHKILKIPTCYN